MSLGSADFVGLMDLGQWTITNTRLHLVFQVYLFQENTIKKYDVMVAVHLSLLHK